MTPRKVLVKAGVLAALTYALLWLAISLRWAWLDTADTWVLDRFHQFGAGRPGWIEFWRAVSDVLSPTALRIVALAGIVGALVRRNIRIAVFLALAIGASGLVTVTAKALSDRPRPDTALTAVSSTAFPSGHALGMAVGALAVIALLWPVLGPRLRELAVVGGVALIVLVGLARVVLNVHHPSDVLAGWALGFLYFLLCLTVVRPLRPNDAAGLHDPDVASPD